MKTNAMEKVYKSAKIDSKNISKFKEMAAFIVDTKCTNVDTTPIIGTDRSDLILEFVEDMHLGELITKNKYIATGVVV